MQDLVKEVVQYGWMMCHAAEQSQDYPSAPAVAGVYTTVNTMKMLVSSAPVRSCLVASSIVH